MFRYQVISWVFQYTHRVCCARIIDLNLSDLRAAKCNTIREQPCTRCEKSGDVKTDGLCATCTRDVTRFVACPCRPLHICWKIVRRADGHVCRIIGFDKCGACCLRKQKADNDKKLNKKPKNLKSVKNCRGKKRKRRERKDDIRVRKRPANRDIRGPRKRGTRVHSCTKDSMNMSFPVIERRVYTLARVSRVARLVVMWISRGPLRV